MKKIALFIRLVVLTLSLNTFATGNPKQSSTEPLFGLTAATGLTNNQESEQTSYFVGQSLNRFEIADPAADISNEWFAEIAVFLIIIAVYSLYWFLFCVKKESH